MGTKHNTKLLTREDILRAMRVTRSNKQASRYLNVSYETYRKYSITYYDKESGKSLFELHKNVKGTGIPRFIKNFKHDTPLEKLLDGNFTFPSYPVASLKHRLIHQHIIPEECNSCGFKEQRVSDRKVPLMINFKNGNKKYWTLENIEFLCFNCYFLKIGDIFTNKDNMLANDFHRETKMVEDPVWEMDENMREHFKDLGILNDEDDKDPLDFTDYKTN